MHTRTNFAFDVLRPTLRAAAVVMYGWIATSSPGVQSPPERPLESFKSFLASPPAIQEVVYCKFTPPNPLVGLPEIVDTNMTNATLVYYRGCYQPNCLFLQARKDSNFTTDIEPLGEGIWIRRTNAFWMIDSTGLAVSWDNSTTGPEDINTSPAFAFHHFSEELSQIINMGLMHVDLGAVEWDGNKFAAPGFILEIRQRVHIRGELLAGEDGYPTQLNVEYLVGSNTHHYIERYAYEKKLELAYLPSSIKSFLISNGKEIKLMEWKIFSIKTNAVTMPPAAFDGRAALASRHIRAIAYSNQNFYAGNALGFQAPIRNGSGSGGSPGANQGSYIFLAVTGISTLALFAGVWKNQKQSKQRKNQLYET